jgi:hypothetical protein
MPCHLCLLHTIAGLFSIFLEEIGLGPVGRPLITNRELVKLWERILAQSDKDPSAANCWWFRTLILDVILIRVVL